MDGASKTKAGKPSELQLDSMAFGKPNRPSTPINGVISNVYGESAVTEINQRYELNAELVRLN